jgi:hypothetical protein
MHSKKIRGKKKISCYSEIALNVAVHKKNSGKNILHWGIIHPWQSFLIVLTVDLMHVHRLSSVGRVIWVPVINMKTSSILHIAVGANTIELLQNH